MRTRGCRYDNRPAFSSPKASPNSCPRTSWFFFGGSDPIVRPSRAAVRMDPGKWDAPSNSKYGLSQRPTSSTNSKLYLLMQGIVESALITNLAGTGDYDLATFAIYVVDRPLCSCTPKGDAFIELHSNSFSLVRGGCVHDTRRGAAEARDPLRDTVI
ncbi:hypothetical protein BJV74DRAFT_793396 [Russula compacta]|nr:hypothetical protein BJV74DRAFT_793396 [Russula compacta]